MYLNKFDMNLTNFLHKKFSPKTVYPFNLVAAVGFIIHVLLHSSITASEQFSYIYSFFTYTTYIHISLCDQGQGKLCHQGVVVTNLTLLLMVWRWMGNSYTAVYTVKIQQKDIYGLSPIDGSFKLRERGDCYVKGVAINSSFLPNKQLLMAVSAVKNMLELPNL